MPIGIFDHASDRRGAMNRFVPDRANVFDRGGSLDQKANGGEPARGVCARAPAAHAGNGSSHTCRRLLGAKGWVVYSKKSLQLHRATVQREKRSEGFDPCPIKGVRECARAQRVEQGGRHVHRTTLECYYDGAAPGVVPVFEHTAAAV